jgi:hypothetical protein
LSSPGGFDKSGFMKETQTLTKFAEQGFLSDESNGHAANFPSDYPEWSALYRDLNRFVQHVRTDLLKGPNDKVMHAVEVCLHRAANTFQAIYLLNQRGLDSDCKSLVRSLLESLYTLVTARMDHQKFLNYLITDHKKSIQKFGEMKGLTDPADTKKLQELDTLIAEFEKDCESIDLNWKNVPSVSIRQLADAAGMDSTYVNIYSYLCKHTHFSQLGVSNLYTTDFRDKKFTYHIGVDYSDAVLNLKFPIHVMLVVISHVLDMIKGDQNPDYLALKARHDTLIANP